MKRILSVLLVVVMTYGCKSGGGSDMFILDMVHHNPGEAFTVSEFNDPEKLSQYGFNGQVINEFQSVHCAINYENYDKRIFPKGSDGRLWVDSLAEKIDTQIERAHVSGQKVYYFTDIIVLPKKMKELYAEQICDEQGRIDITKPKTQQIHREMIAEIFDRFSNLDGLVIRVGETYLHNIPYHTGNGPIKRDESKWKHTGMDSSDGGEQTHRVLIDLLRDELCVKRNKTLLYRTWDFGFFHTNPQYYLTVTDSIEPHKNLYFMVKHVKGDYHRTLPFNPTLGIGRHKQIVEVQCQREYEGKGAYPNYIAKGVIDGFEELNGQEGIKSLRELSQSELFAGVWTWSRGGGWVGPYIQNELWCDMNAYILAQWAKNTDRTEQEIFMEYAAMRGFDKANAKRLHKIALLSADAVVRGRGSLSCPVDVWWTRDEFVGGLDYLAPVFDKIIEMKLEDVSVAEKRKSVDIWREIVTLADSLEGRDDKTIEYVRTSARYGHKLYSIYAATWQTLLKCHKAEKQGTLAPSQFADEIKSYGDLWSDYNNFCQTAPQCATPYKPYSFVNQPPKFHGEEGAQKSVNKYMPL